MKGQYKVRSEALLSIYGEAKALIRKLDRFEIRHVLRHLNKDADRLANAAMDRGMGRASSRQGRRLRQASGGARRDQRAARICERGRGGIYRRKVSRRSVRGDSAGAVAGPRRSGKAQAVSGLRFKTLWAFHPASAFFTASLTCLPSMRAPAKLAITFFMIVPISLAVGEPISAITDCTAAAISAGPTALGR